MTEARRSSPSDGEETATGGFASFDVELGKNQCFVSKDNSNNVYTSYSKNSFLSVFLRDSLGYKRLLVQIEEAITLLNFKHHKIII